MKLDCSGIILAGGKNRRFPGKAKTLRTVGDQVILKRIHQVFSDLFKEVIVVVNQPGLFAGWDMNIVTDIYPDGCALAGLHAGLFYSENNYAFVSACDTPFVDPQVIRKLAGKISSGKEVIIPRTNEGFEPLAAVYSKACIPKIEAKLDNKEYKIQGFFNRRRVLEVPVKELVKIDPDLDFIFNVNTPEDLETARKIDRIRILKEPDPDKA